MTMQTTKPAAVSWVPRLDPMRGLLGSRTSVAPRPGTRPAPAPLRVVRETPPPAPVLSCDEEEPLGVEAATEVPVPAPLSPEQIAARDLRNAARRADYALAGLSRDSVRGRLLLALASLGGSATTGELTLAAWRAWPESFGLTGHEAEAPCSNSVLAKLSGATGLVGTGYVQRPELGRYALTARGRAWCDAARLRS